MNQKDIKKLLQNKLKKSFSNIKIFEEGIDVDTQIEFEKKTKKILNSAQKIIKINISENNLFNESYTFDQKKQILIELSFSDDVKAYRLIEKFQIECEPELKSWSALALQKSRAHIEHSLSNEDKVYISSGLGGSGNKLRYFFVLTSMDDISFTDLHKTILRKEIEFAVEKHQGTVEDVLFYDYFVTIVCLIPIHFSLDKIFKNILDECNELGNFLSDRIIATNTEKFDKDTIVKILNDDPETIDSFEDHEDPDIFGLDEDEFFDDDDEDEDDFDDDDDDEDDYF